MRNHNSISKFSFRRNLIKIWLCAALLALFGLWLWLVTLQHPKENQQSTQMEQSKPTSTVDEKEEEPEQQVEVALDLQTFYKNPNDRVITFYYSWYGNPEHNKEWLHWNHEILVEGGSKFQPPDDIGANFYPYYGPYSSIDRKIVIEHMKDMRAARIGVLCLSWWGRSSDSQLTHLSGYTDSTTALILDTAAKYGIKVCFHHEPYKGRTALSVKQDLQYMMKKYGKHPAFYKDPKRGNRSILFVYDSYLTPATEWNTILNPDSQDSIRGTDHDFIMISLLVDQSHKKLILEGGFDGLYSYFATNGFTYGSTIANWKELADWAITYDKLFIPSVGPGYDDTRIRPWNERNKRSRERGAYYDNMWQKALGIHPQYISITSWNEWHEGTQIEPAMPKSVKGFHYSDYSPMDPFFYLQKTSSWIDMYTLKE